MFLKIKRESEDLTSKIAGQKFSLFDRDDKLLGSGVKKLIAKFSFKIFLIELLSGIFPHRN